MSSPQAAIAEIEKFVKVFKAFEYAKESLETLANIEQVTKEQNKAKEVAKQELESILFAVEEAKKLLKDTKEKGKVQLEKVEQAVKDASEGKLEAAQAEALKILSEATTHAKEIEEKVFVLKNKDTELKQAIKAKEQELTALEAKLDSVKQAINKFLG